MLGASKMALDVDAGAAQPGQLGLGQLDRPPGLLGEQVAFGLTQRGELGLQGAFQGAGDQPVLRLHGVVLAPGPVGFEPGPFHRQGERPQGGGVRGFGVTQRLDGGLERGRGQDREHLGQDPLLQTSAAQLWQPFSPP